MMKYPACHNEDPATKTWRSQIKKERNILKKERIVERINDPNQRSKNKYVLFCEYVQDWSDYRAEGTTLE